MGLKTHGTSLGIKLQVVIWKCPGTVLIDNGMQCLFFTM